MSLGEELIPLVSVITAVGDDGTFLGEAYETLSRQQLDWEWVIQFDGSSRQLPDHLDSDKRVKIDCNGDQLGQAITRNLALARSRADHVQIWDAYAQTDPALSELLSLLLDHPGAAFAALGRVGKAQRSETIESGVLADHWLEQGLLPCSIQGMLWRKQILLSCGGQAALDEGGDVCTALVAAERHPVCLLDRIDDEHSFPAADDLEAGARSYIFQRLEAARLSDEAPGIPSEQKRARKRTAVQGREGLISVITPVHDPEAPYLEETYRRLLEQDFTDWEWILQFDGADWQPPAWLDDPRVRPAANGKHLGVANTRNLALARSEGALIQTLDSDDFLLPGALQAMADVLEKDPTLVYALGRVHHLVDGRYSDRDDSGREMLTGKPAFGVLQPGVVADFWLEKEAMPFSLNCICWRREVLFVIGGWAAMKVGEDGSLFIHASDQHPGYWLDRYTLVYRQHPASAMHQPRYWEQYRPQARKFNIERLQALRADRA